MAMRPVSVVLCSLLFAAVASAEALCRDAGPSRFCYGDLTVKAVSGTKGTTPPPPHVVSGGQTSMHVGNRVWFDLLTSSWAFVPEWLRGTSMLVPDSIVSERRQVMWQCAHERCEVFVFAYTCPGCSPKAGALQALLAAEGFDTLRCGATVLRRTGGRVHPLAGFVKGLDKSQTYTLVLPETTEYVTFGMTSSAATPQCEGRLEVACGSSKCSWDSTNDVCYLRDVCPKPTPIGPFKITDGGRGGRGPDPVCPDVCLDDDLDFRP